MQYKAIGQNVFFFFIIIYVDARRTRKFLDEFSAAVALISFRAHFFLFLFLFLLFLFIYSVLGSEPLKLSIKYSDCIHQKLKIHRGIWILVSLVRWCRSFFLIDHQKSGATGSCYCCFKPTLSFRVDLKGQKQNKKQETK